MDGAIQKAKERMAYVAQDKEALRAYQMREMALSDLVSGLNHARREGLQEGLEKGIEKGRQEGIEKSRFEIAAKMKKPGVPVDQIAEDTGLSVKAITEL
jgi:predicted transposase/invertase (TIGR01784 family)